MTDGPANHWHQLEPLPGRVLAEQSRLLHEQVPQSLGGGLGVAIIISVLIFSEIPLTWLLVWWAFYLLTFAFRLISYQLAKISLHNDDDAVAWAKFSRLPLFLGGLYWGLTAALAIYTGDLVEAAVTIAILAGLSAGAAGALSAIHVCYLAYAIPMTLPAIIALLTVGGSEYYSLALLTLIFMLANAIFARNIYRGMTTMILTRLENESLIHSMEQQQQELELKSTEAQNSALVAYEANQAKSVFLAAASHDLAQPMHSMRLFLLALRAENDPKTQKSLIDKALQCGDSLSELFMALLDISRLDAGDVSIKKEVFDIAEVIDTLNEEFSVQAIDSGIQFSVSSASCVVDSDATFLQRILRNLLSNAFKYSPGGHVELSSKLQGNDIVIVVKDTGIGIPKAQLDDVFKEFYQVGNVERDRSKGLGLGLAIVERLSALLEIAIEIDSELGAGTTVSIRLPISDKPRSITDACQTEADSATSHGHHTVVFIDDERETRDAMQQVFNKSGFTLYTAEDVNTAMQVLTANDAVPDLVISDYRLKSGSTGVEAILHLREEFNLDLPALIISGDSQLSSLHDIRDNDIGFLHKLAPHHELEQTIYTLLK